MNKKVLLISIAILLVFVTVLFVVKTASNKHNLIAPGNQLELEHLVDIPMNGGTNRWDYQSINYENNRLYISHLGSNLVTVFDLKSQKIIKDIPVAAALYGILVVPQLKTVYVGIGGNNQVAVIDEKSLQVTKYIRAGETPDGLAYDPNTNKVFVTNENGGTVTVINAITNGYVQDISVGGSVGNTHLDPVSKTIYTVSGDDNTLININPVTNKITKKYNIDGCTHPHGFYIEEQTHYAFITCAENNKMVVFDLNTKKNITTETVGSSPDVLAYDPGLHRLYVAAESGYLSVFNVQKDKITKLSQEFIADSAHTVSVDKNTHYIYLPLENVNGKPVLRVYKPKT